MEIRNTGTFQVKPSSAGTAVAAGASAVAVTTTGSNWFGGELSISASYTPLPIGSCSSVRYVFIKNDSTASIDVAVNTTASHIARLEEDDTLCMPGTGSITSYYVKASGAEADIQYILVEE